MEEGEETTTAFAVEDQRRDSLAALNTDFSTSDGLLEQKLAEAQQQVADHHDRLTSVIGATTFDVIDADDEYEWSKFDPLPLVRAFVYQFVSPEIENTEQLATRLKTHPDEAQDLGFEAGTPSRETFRTAWEGRFSAAVRSHIEYLAEKAAINGRNYGFDVDGEHVRLWDTRDGEPDPTDINSDEKKRAIKHIRPVVYDLIETGRAENTQFHDNWIFDQQAEISREQDFAQKNIDEKHDAGEFAPSAPAFFDAIETNETAEWAQQFEDVFERCVAAIQGAGQADRPIDVMIDGSDIPFHGVPDAEGVVGTKKSSNTHYAYKHVTISARLDGRTIKIASFPLRDRSNMHQAVMYLIRRARDLVPIRRLYMDSEFSKVTILEWLDSEGIDFIVNYPKKGGEIKNWLASLTDDAASKPHTISPANRSESKRVQMIAKWSPNGSDSSDDGQAALDQFEDGEPPDEGRSEGRWDVYVTNIEAAAENPGGWAEKYSDRWAIETNYRVVKEDFLARTTSRKYRVRVFYWLFALMLYNAWVLLDVLLRADFPDLAPDDRPVMPARSFAKQFYNFDPG